MIPLLKYLLITAPLWLVAPGLQEVRELYYKATEDESSAKKFFTLLENHKADGDPVLYGYRGMSHLIRANHSWNPVKKLSWFESGRDMLEEAIRRAPENAELRFMRYSVQTNAPAFLNYDGNLSDDRRLLERYLANEPKADADLYSRISKYLKEYR